MTYPKAIVVAATLLAGAMVWSAHADNGAPTAEQIRAIAGGELIWWFEPSPRGTLVSVCEYTGRQIKCLSESLEVLGRKLP